MWRRIIPILLLSLLLVSPVPGHAQDIGGEVTGALQTFFGGGGTIPVIDRSVLAQEIIQVAKFVQEIGILLEELALSRKNSIMSGGWGTDQIARMIAMMAEHGQPGSILASRDTDLMWKDAFKPQLAYADGRWLEEQMLRNEKRETTQQDLLHLLHIRQQTFAADNERLLMLQRNVSGSIGRNTLLGAQADLQAEKIRQDHAKQQLDIIIANAQTVMAGGEVYDLRSREAQERYFFENGVAGSLAFEDRGL